MKNNKSFIGLFLAILVLLPGCIHVPSYKRKSLKTTSAHCTDYGSQNNITVQVKRLNEPEVQYLFGSRGEKLKDQCEILYLSVHNLSNSSYLFSPANIDLATMSYHDVVRLMKTSSVSKLAVAGVGGGLSYSFGVTAAFAIGDLGVSSLPVLAAILAPSILFPSVALVMLGSSIKSIVINKRMSKDVKEKTLHEKVIINPGEQYEGLIFVKSSDYTSQFSVTMHEKNNKKNIITFDVDLSNNES